MCSHCLLFSRGFRNGSGRTSVFMIFQHCRLSHHDQKTLRPGLSDEKRDVYRPLQYVSKKNGQNCSDGGKKKQPWTSSRYSQLWATFVPLREVYLNILFYVVFPHNDAARN